MKTRLNYYRRYQQDGSCIVICTRCFLTVGIVHGQSAVRDLEAGHVCANLSKAPPAENQPEASSESRIQPASAGFAGSLDFLRAVTRSNALLVFAGLAIVLYFLPTALESLAAHYANPWLSIILPGDALGCGALVAVFKFPRTGFLLYPLLTGLEGSLYVSRYITPAALLWIADLVPTLVAMGVFLYMRRTQRTAFAAAAEPRL